MTVTPASPPDPPAVNAPLQHENPMSSDPDHRQTQTQSEAAMPSNPSSEATTTQSHSPPELNWDIPQTPPAKRGFFAPVTQFFSAKRGQKRNFAQEDTEYHAPSKESSGMLAGGAAVGGGGAAVAGMGTSSGGGRLGGMGMGIKERFDEMIPPRRTYFGRSRKTFLLGVAVVVLCLLALILGLAIGLTMRHSSSSSSLPLPSNTTIQTGDITYYDPGGPGYGSCGLVSYSTDAICAISHILYDAASTSSNPNDNPLCGREIRITRFDQSEGKNNSVDVKVVDRCVGCAVDDLDLSQSVFAELADVGLGRVEASWAWLGE